MKQKDLHIKIEGSGSPMILLHGWGCNMKMMQPIADYFKKNYRILNLDLPGFGKNEKLERSYCVYDYVMVIHDLVKQYNLENPVIIAHSFGARIAFLYASLFPVDFLIVTGAAGIPPKRGISYYMKIYMYKFLKWFHIQNNMGSQDYRNASGLLKRTLVNVVNDDSTDVIKQIQCPILLVWGEKDLDTPLYMAKRIEKLNEKVSLVVFEGDDHFAYYHQMNRFIRVCDYALKGSE